MNRNLLLVIALIVLGSVAYALLRSGQIQVQVPGLITPTPTATATETEQPTAAPTPTTTSTPTPEKAQKDDLIKVDTPLINEVVKSPLQVAGQARGNWYFEGSFPISIYDSNNKLLAKTAAKAQGDWTTTSYVPFTSVLNFSMPTTETGYIVLEKDNPSGLPENANELKVQVKFK